MCYLWISFTYLKWYELQFCHWCKLLTFMQKKSYMNQTAKSKRRFVFVLHNTLWEQWMTPWTIQVTLTQSWGKDTPVLVHLHCHTLLFIFLFSKTISEMLIKYLTHFMCSFIQLYWEFGDGSWVHWYFRVRISERRKPHCIPWQSP